MWLEKSIPQLQTLMASGQLDQPGAGQGLPGPHPQLNPLLHAVIETNPHAVGIAARLDDERRARHDARSAARHPDSRQGQHRHRRSDADDGGIAGDRRQPCAGRCHDRQSAARRGRGDPRERPTSASGRTSAVSSPLILSVGWSARGGNTINPYRLSYTSWGSSSGSGNRAAANLCAAASRVGNGRVHRRSRRSKISCSA